MSVRILMKKKSVEECLSRRSTGVETESVAFVVGTVPSAEHPELKLDFLKYSFEYIARWFSGKETAELKASLERIQATAGEMISEIKCRLWIPRKIFDVFERQEALSHHAEPKVGF